MKKLAMTLGFGLVFGVCAVHGSSIITTNNFLGGAGDVAILYECNITLSEKDSDYMSNVSDFLYQRADLIATKFPGTTTLTYDMARKIENSIYYNCEGEYFSTYAEFTKGFGEYIGMLIARKNLKLYQYTPDPEASKAVLQLQKHITKIL